MAASLSARPHRHLFQILISRRLPSVSQVVQQHASSTRKEQSEPSVKMGEIMIPRKKKRDALSVLRALASTVTRDPNAPHFKYMDDPFLIPTSSLSKKSYALSKESGRKAAYYMLENYAQWFNENPSEPSIGAFMPSRLAYAYTEPTEAALLERIEKRRVKDAVEVYRKMKQGQQEVSQDSLRLFLELLCVFNSQDPPVASMPEEFFYRKDLSQDTRRPCKTWKDDDMAERIYDALEEKTSQDRQNLIRGMARHLQTEKAFAMYSEMMEQGMPVDCLTFDLLIRAATFHQDTYDTKWKQVESLLQDMQRTGLEPKLSTFNSVLFSLARIPVYRAAPALALRTLNEMRALGIEPSLASWKYVLTVFYPNENTESDMLHRVMDHLQGKEFELSDPEDMEFFATAMRVCCLNLHDPHLAFRIDALLRTAHNEMLLGDSRLENMYYSHFLKLLCAFETLDKIMEVYQHVTPHLWCPNYSVMGEVMKAVELQDGYAYLPLLWTDLLLFQFLNNAELLETLLRLMAKKKQEPELQSQFMHVVHQLMEQWKDEQEEGRQPSLTTGAMVDHLITIAENADNHTVAWEVFEAYRDHRNSFRGTPSSDAFMDLLTGCLARGEGEQALGVVTMMQALEVGGASEAAQRILGYNNLQLTSAQRDMLVTM